VAKAAARFVLRALLFDGSLAGRLQLHPLVGNHRRGTIDVNFDHQSLRRRPMPFRRSIRWPIILGVVLIVLLVALTVGWVIVSASAALQSEHSGVYWTLLAVGATFFVLVLVGVVFYLVLSVKAIRLNQRQSNFIDAVTHEFKSPIASLKLYLQTLTRHQVTDEQQADFRQFMLEDLERLDHLIDHLLDAARLEHSDKATEAKDVSLDDLLTHVAKLACERYRLPDDTIQLRLQPTVVHARPADLEIVFRNLLDNALKYSGEKPQVEVETFCGNNDHVTARIGDNGPGIPIHLRRKIFGRFVRLGSELERKTAGTGLGLYIVRTLVKRMGGKIQVHSKVGSSGTVFEVELPTT
jgi:two-component system, OmpR family, phosphate regulon sensor histidine kinase PhoR